MCMYEYAHKHKYIYIYIYIYTGATTLSVMTLSITTFSITTLSTKGLCVTLIKSDSIIDIEHSNALTLRCECRVLFIIMLKAVMLNVVAPYIYILAYTCTHTYTHHKQTSVFTRVWGVWRVWGCGVWGCVCV